ncbi:MAG: hotdog fold thioesterase [Bacteroidota bacterium]|nr:hotdog fold thioesterase [Bacteroidota bacterium]
MTNQELAEKNVRDMVDNDPYSRWLGIQVLEITPGKVKAKMSVRNDMLNAFRVCHGGVTFALADSVLAFSCNTHGKISVSIEASMAYPNPVYEGDVIIASAEEQSSTEKIGIYNVSVKKENGTLVGVFRGVVYRTKKEFSV